MQKRLSPIITATLSVLAASSLTACGVLTQKPSDESPRVAGSNSAPAETPSKEPQKTPSEAPQETPAPVDTPTPEPSAAPTDSDDPAADAVHAALDRYVEAERATIPQVHKDNPGVYSNIVFDKEYPDMAIFTYTYAVTVDAKKTAAALDGQISTIENLLTAGVYPAMKSAGVVPKQRVRFTYLNSDGSTVWSKDFASS